MMIGRGFWVLFLTIIISLSAVSIYLIGDFGTGYKVIVRGNVSYESEAFTIDSFWIEDIVRDWKVFQTEPLWWWDIDAVVIVLNINNGEYKGDVNLGSFSGWGDTKPFLVTARHVPAGLHTGQLEVWQIFMGPAGLPLWEEYRVLEYTSEEFNIHIQEVGSCQGCGG